MKIYASLKNSVFRAGIDEKSQIKPIRLALYVTILYATMVSFYFWYSREIALSISKTIENLAAIDLTKELAFVLATAIALFTCLYTTLKKIEKKDNIILSQNKSIISTERLVMAGIFSSSVCHDINNIMSIIVGTIDIDLLADSKNMDAEDRASIERISDASQKLITLVKKMMDAGKGYIPGEREYENLSNVVDETIDFAKVHIKVRNCLIQRYIQPDLKFDINSILIARTLMNLILNAADATNEAGKILIRLVRDDSLVTIEVHDDGPGVTEDMKEKIFEPFYTSKIDGNGLGLLSLKICAQQHNGMIKLKNSHLGGACFCLSIPMVNSEPKAQQSPQPDCEYVRGADVAGQGGFAGLPGR